MDLLKRMNDFFDNGNFTFFKSNFFIELIFLVILRFYSKIYLNDIPENHNNFLIFRCLERQEQLTLKKNIRLI